MYVILDSKIVQSLRDKSDEELKGEPGHVDGLRQHKQRELLSLLPILISFLQQMNY